MSDDARSPLAAVADALKSVALRPTRTVVTARDGSRTLQSLRSGEVHEPLEPARRAPSPSDAASQLADDPTRAWEVCSLASKTTIARQFAPTRRS